jgi:hypothetical protein
MNQIFSKDEENKYLIITKEIKYTKEICKFNAECLSHFINSIGILKKSVIYKMLKRILLKYKSSLDQFETTTDNKVKYFENKLKEADMYIRTQHQRISELNNISTTLEAREMYKILTR